jgi:cytochrome c oxidase subunit 4
MPDRTPSVKTYFLVFGALLALLALTVGASYINLGPFNLIASLAISIAKALLIMLIFMEVRYSHAIVRLFAGAAFLWLLIMFALTMSDYYSRHWVGPDWREGVKGPNYVEFAKPSR